MATSKHLPHLVSWYSLWSQCLTAQECLLPPSCSRRWENRVDKQQEETAWGKEAWGTLVGKSDAIKSLWLRDMEKWGSKLTKASSKRGKWEQMQILLQEGIKTSWSWDVEGELKGAPKYFIYSRLWQPLRANRRKRVTHELLPHAHRPRYLEALEKSTLGGHTIAGVGTPCSAPGNSCVALGKVQSLSPYVFIVWCIVEAASAVRLSSAVHYTRLMAIQFLQEMYYAFIFNEYKVREPAKVFHWLTSCSYLKFGSLSLFFLMLWLFSRGCKALLSVGKSINLKTENCLCLTLPYK